MSENRVIGLEGDMPWHLTEDLKHFKRVTLGKPVVMGRKTWQSIGRPLPGRANIVVTRDPAFQAQGVTPVTSLEKGIEVARELALAEGLDQIFVIGGGEIYRQAMDRADRLYVTEIQAAPDGDTFFPEIDPGLWKVVDRAATIPAVPATGQPAFRFLILERA